MAETGRVSLRLCYNKMMVKLVWGYESKLFLQKLPHSLLRITSVKYSELGFEMLFQNKEMLTQTRQTSSKAIKSILRRLFKADKIHLLF